MRGEERQDSGVLIGLAVSVVLHVALLWWALSRPPPPPPVPAPAEAIELTVVEVEVTSPGEPPDDAPSSPRLDPPPARPSARAEAPPPPREQPLPPVEAPPEAPEAPEAPAPAERAERPAPELPEQELPGAQGAPPEAIAELPVGEDAAEEVRATGRSTPGAGAPLAGPTAKPGERPWFVPGGSIEVGTRRATRGSTTRPGDDGGAAERERIAEAPRVKGRVDGILAEAGGAYRVATGTMDPYFAELGRALNAELDQIPEALGRPDAVRVLYQDYVTKLGRYGRTGALHDDTPVGAGRERDLMPLAGMSRLDDIRAGTQAPSNPVLLGASAQRGGIPPILSAEVGIRQGPDGRVLEVKLLRASGNAVFDAFVVDVAPASAKRAGTPPERGSGIHADGMRTAWLFTGQLKLDKRLRDFKLPADLPYLAGMALAGQFGGSLDLTNLKDTPVADLRDPRWDLRAKLLRVE